MRKFALAALLALAACTSETDTVRTLRSAGFKDVQATGYQFFACSKDDIFHTGFVATNPAGQRVSGVVCCGLLKSCTVRF